MFAICGWLGCAVPGAGEGVAEPVLAAMLAAGRPAGLAGTAPAGAPDPRRLARARVSVASAAGAALVCLDEDLAVALSEPVTGDDGAVLDARGVARLYRQLGPDAARVRPQALPAALHGSFALALADLKSGTLLLAVDRAGIRPLYLARVGEATAFASRLAAIESLPGFHPTLSDQALFDYLYFHVIPSPGTVYGGVDKLLPAQVAVLDARGTRTAFYWEMPYRDDSPARYRDLKAAFRGLLPEAVATAAAAPLPGPDGAIGRVGCFLSGGTDSSTVVGTWQGLCDAPVRTYSMGFAAQGFDEIEYARLAARRFGTDAREYYVQPQDVLEAIPRVGAYTDEPFANASIVPAYLCARFAREDGCTRLLGGDGGDEIFGGNARYANQQVFEIYRNLPTALRRGLVDPVADLPGLGSVPVLRKLKSYVEQARVPLPDRLESWNFLHRTPLSEIFEPDFLARVDPEAPLVGQRACYERARSAAIVNRMMHLDLKITLADNDLRKVSQACELAGIDVRYPLLDERIMDFAAGVPPHMQLSRNRLRWFFKQALADFLPPEIIAKKKHGFGLPVGLWMAEYPPLRELTETSLANLARRGLVRADYLNWLKTRHAGEHASYYGVMLWVLVTLEQWLAAHGHT